MSTTTITPELAERLNLNDNMLFVRAAFFLGLGTVEIGEYIENVLLAREKAIIIDTALKLGMSDQDNIKVM